MAKVPEEESYPKDPVHEIATTIHSADLTMAVMTSTGKSPTFPRMTQLELESFMARRVKASHRVAKLHLWQGFHGVAEVAVILQKSAAEG